MSALFVATTVLEFEDRFKGQALCIGTKEECDRTAEMINAIAYTGSDRVLSSCIKVANAPTDWTVGVQWMYRKGSGATDREIVQTRGAVPS